MGFQGSNRFNADARGRGSEPFTGPDMNTSQRAGFGAEQNPNAKGGQEVLSSAPAGNPHSSSGFRRALMKTARGGNRLKDQLPNKKTFGGKGFTKPNAFAQGGKRHGMHIGAGAPFTGPSSDDTGANFGG
jgi:hypothetical protein